MAHACTELPRAGRVARRERKTSIALPPATEGMAEEASERLLEDDSLRPGDVVSTNRGLFDFKARWMENGGLVRILTKTSESAAARVLAIPILQHPRETSASGLA